MYPNDPDVPAGHNAKKRSDPNAPEHNVKKKDRLGGHGPNAKKRSDPDACGRVWCEVFPRPCRLSNETHPPLTLLTAVIRSNPLLR